MIFELPIRLVERRDSPVMLSSMRAFYHTHAFQLSGAIIDYTFFFSLFKEISRASAKATEKEGCG